MRDPEIRSYSDSPPYMGGGVPVRYRWPDPASDGVRRIRQDVQEGGRALFCLYDPLLETEVLVECLYSDEIWNADYRRPEGQLDPFQYDDFQRGGLVALMPWPRGGPVHESRWPVPNPWMLAVALAEIRECNRSARKELKRTRTDSYHALDLKNAAEEKDKEYEKLADEIAEGVGEDLHFATYAKSFVSKDIGGD
jgi:hypothetical protein